MSRKDEQIIELETTIEGLAVALVDGEREADRLEGSLVEARVAVGVAITDLRALGEVPLGQLEACIEAVIESLRTVLV